MEFIPTGDVVASLRAAKDMALLAVSNYDQSRVP